MSSDYGQCMDFYASSLQKFESLVVLSLVLSLFVGLFAHKKRNEWREHPMMAANFFLVVGVLKSLFGLLLFTLFSPTCPENCLCPDYRKSVMYPTIVLVIATYWIMKGCIYLRLAFRTEISTIIAGDEISTSETLHHMKLGQTDII